MISVASIVEGDGEVVALPVLLRRLGEWLTPGTVTQILPPIRVRKDRFLNRPDEFSRHLLLAGAKAGDSGWTLVVLDADDDCPATKSEEILAQARAVVPHRKVAIVLANREYEAWFLAAAASLNGRRGFLAQYEDLLVEAEIPRNAKGWMGERMAAGAYHETTDQPAFSALIDLDSARSRSRSFRKLCSEWSKSIAELS